MKLKKRYVFSLLGILTLAYYFCTGGMVVFFGSRFSYVLPEDYDCHKPDPSPEERIYIPDDYHFRYKETNIPFLFYVWFFNYQRTPCSLELYTCDPTYLQSDMFYDKFCIDEILVTYENGDVDRYDETNRNFLGKEHLIENKIVSIPNILEKSMNVQIQINGYTLKKNGEKEVFSKIQKYTCERYFKVYTFWQILCSI